MANKRQAKKNSKNLEELLKDIGTDAVASGTSRISKKANAVTKAAVSKSKKVRGSVKTTSDGNVSRILIALEDVGSKDDTYNTGPRLIDLKKSFAKSPYRKTFNRWDNDKQRVVRGWYMDVPIRRKTYRADRKDWSSYMTSGLYSALRKADEGTVQVSQDLLYAARNSKLSANIGELNYEPKTSDINKITDSATGRSQYVAIRRVSSNSPPNSWLINRKSARRDDPEVQRIIEEMSKIDLSE